MIAEFVRFARRAFAPRGELPGDAIIPLDRNLQIAIHGLTPHGTPP